MARKEKVLLDICIEPKNNNIGILIGNFELEDLASKIKLFLCLIKDFAILEITTSID